MEAIRSSILIDCHNEKIATSPAKVARLRTSHDREKSRMKKILRASIALALSITLSFTLSACGTGDESGESMNASSNIPVVTGNFGEEPSFEIPLTDPPTELEIVDLVIGTGATVNANSFLTVNYSLKAWTSGQLVESSFASGPAEFPLSGVIAGWQQGLLGVKEGGRRLLVIPPDLGYGDQGAGAAIAPGETLVFVVDVIKAVG